MGGTPKNKLFHLVGWTSSPWPQAGETPNAVVPPQEKLDIFLSGSPLDYKQIIFFIFRISNLYACSSICKELTISECVSMTRRNPPNNGKPPKTEPGSIRFDSNNKNQNKPQAEKSDETK